MISDYRVTDQSIDNIYDNGLLTKPTPLHSMYMSGKGGFITGYKFIGDIGRKAYGLPENTQLKETVELIQRERSVEGQGGMQRLGNWVADMVGYSISPPVLALGSLGGLASRGLFAVGKLAAPKTVIPLLERTVGNTTVGKIGERLTSGALTGEFSGIPLAFEEGSANVAHAMGGLGFAISSIPILFGLRKGLRPKPESKLETEATKVITPNAELSDINKWHHDADNGLDTIENLEKRATTILQKEGFKVDPVTHQVEFNVLEAKDVKNLQSAVLDSMTSEVSDANRNHLIDYIVNNRVDEIAANPKSKAMLNAYDSFITGKLALRESIIAEADRIHESNLKVLTNKAFLSQPEIKKAIKGLSKEEKHVSALPFVLPENIEKEIHLESRISSLRKKPVTEKRLKLISELEKKIQKILSPKDELRYLKHRIIDKKEYRNTLKSRAYQRLEQLSDHWPQAKSLMDRVKLEESFERQQVIKDALDRLKTEIERPVEKRANTDNVISYLKEKLEGVKVSKNPIEEKIKNPDQKIAEASKVPADLGITVNEQTEFVDNLIDKAPMLKKEFEMHNNRIRQFKKSDKALSELIQCILGAK